MQKCLENKQKANEKVLKENELKKEIININSQLQQRKDEITKKVKENNNHENENNECRYQNNKNSNNDHQTIKQRKVKT